VLFFFYYGLKKLMYNEQSFLFIKYGGSYGVGSMFVDRGFWQFKKVVVVSSR